MIFIFALLWFILIMLASHFFLFLTLNTGHLKTVAQSRNQKLMTQNRQRWITNGLFTLQTMLVLNGFTIWSYHLFHIESIVNGKTPSRRIICYANANFCNTFKTFPSLSNWTGLLLSHCKKYFDSNKERMAHKVIFATVKKFKCKQKRSHCYFFHNCGAWVVE